MYIKLLCEFFISGFLSPAPCRRYENEFDKEREGEGHLSLNRNLNFCQALRRISIRRSMQIFRTKLSIFSQLRDLILTPFRAVYKQQSAFITSIAVFKRF